MAIYDFIDTTEAPAGSVVLPAEALSINGTFIENEIDGYRTLTVSGREAMAQEVKEAEVGKHDGAFFQYRRYPTRDIVVTFQLITNSTAEFREAFIKLNSLLDFEEGQLIFNDEPDKYFIGTPTEVETPEPGLNTVTGEFTLHCEDPFKYSIEEKTATLTESDNGPFFLINYEGTHKAYPSVDITFYQSDTEDDQHGDCSFVSLMTQEGRVLQFGDPDDTNVNQTPVRIFKRASSAPAAPTSQIEYSFDTEAIVNTSALNGWSETIPTGSAKLWTTKAIASSTSTLAYIEASEWGTVEEYDDQDDSGDYKRIMSKTEINKTFATIGSDWPTNSGKLYNDFIQTGTATVITDSTLNKKFAGGNTYGSGSNWHGPSLTRSTADNIKDWCFSFEYRFGQYSTSGATSNYSHKLNSTGIQQAVLWNSTGSKIIAAIVMWKLAGTSKGSIRLVVGGKSVKLLTGIDFSNSAIYAKKNGKKTARACSIKKLGSTFVFTIRDKEYRFVDETLEETAVNRCTFYFGTKTSSNRMLDGVRNVILRKIYQEDPPNPFTTNDMLTINANDASVQLNGLDAQNLGALGNDWEHFYLKPGTNQIGVAWSGWTADEYKPDFVLRYREVYL